MDTLIKEEPLKVVELTAQNIMRLKAVRIRPDGRPVVIVGGRNAQGKTSVLEAITLALGGKRAAVPRPIREGEDKAGVQVDLGEYVVTRTYNPDRLRVERKDGSVVGSPQTVLNDMLGDLTFDPLALLRMSPKEQAETVKTIVGLDLSELDEKEADLYEERREAKAELKAALNRLDAIDVPEDAPTEYVNTDALMQELEAREVAHTQHTKAVSALNAAQAEKERLDKRIESLKAQLKAAEEERAEVSAEIKQLTDLVERAEVPSLDEIRKAIAEAQEINRKVDAKRSYLNLKDEAKKLKEAVQVLEDQIQAVRDERKRLIAGAQIPVEGLSFGPEGLTLNGIPFEQCSQSEQLRVSFALAVAANPTIGITLIRDASLLDADSLAQIAEMAEQYGVQVWLERVGDDPAAFIIEDGEVVREPVE